MDDYTAEGIIAAIVALVPPPTAFIPDLVQAGLPEVIPEEDCKPIKAEEHLVNLEITGDLSHVLDGPMPHKTWVASLRNALEKAEKAKQTVTAIEHPTEKGLVLPLWVIPVWDSIADAAQQWMLWVQATDWLRPGNHRQEDLRLVEQARGLMARIPWGSMAWALPGYEGESLVGFLANFLSFAWLAERNLDILAILCNIRSAKDVAKRHHYVTSVYLGRLLQSVGGWDAERIRKDSDLTGWKVEAANKGYRFIHIPANLANCHWVIFRIDITAKAYTWGMLQIYPLVWIPDADSKSLLR